MWDGLDESPGLNFCLSTSLINNPWQTINLLSIAVKQIAKNGNAKVNYTENCTTVSVFSYFPPLGPSSYNVSAVLFCCDGWTVFVQCFFKMRSFGLIDWPLCMSPSLPVSLTLWPQTFSLFPASVSLLFCFYLSRYPCPVAAKGFLHKSEKITAQWWKLISTTQ